MKGQRAMPWVSTVSLSVEGAMVLAEPHLDTQCLVLGAVGRYEGGQ